MDTLAPLLDFTNRLLLVIHGIRDCDLRRPEAEGRWSILQVIGHLMDHELVTATRLRFQLATGDQKIVGYDQERFVALHANDSLADLLEQFGALQVEIDAGAVWPDVDYHVPGPEEVYVVSGDFRDGVNEYRAGSFVHHPAGSSHVPQSRDGCTLFVFYPEG